ncbi:type I-E CRISPR-associated protein Cas7/Cse4/CasC [Streptomyces sp. ME02-7008A-1]|uniref:type I-E CRISPR-associated protein Cas7/Cse4/CasC n=1 Tax=unclassified Streptomyces TaxID=2593676 RepID=UPI0029BF59D4|nr:MULTISPECIES: type I-E CRISPR-associated protein Cas7/Cse4/CasC [unclassified Streptomyces]MDX3180483.1 type I-E CRISPR-associated protein Cas7/Cse4/CasC [Streptomyces sp. ME02-7008A-1]MDX3301224.1 type I-E CRISPR-associated protein Cas7/Cse4/CasC [Streptomyces sp. ME02-7008A]
MTLYLDLNALQSVPAANLNRDDLGSPKQVRYGNALRIRVSSQSWKRPIRHGVEKDLGEKAARTRLVPAKVQQRLERAGWPTDLAAFAGSQVAVSAGKKGIGLEAAGHTSVLLFLPEAAIEELTTVCAEHREPLETAMKKATSAKKRTKAPQVLPPNTIEEILKRRTASISLLGRMLAELPDANVDGAAQVAHAFTTHAAEPQRDYFTAVDDWLGESETGSGHLDTAEFAAGVFYRYGTVNVTDLLKNLEGDVKATRTVLASFAEHFLMSLPQAKKNSTAPHTLPDLAYLAVREHRPLSLAAAFETPVTADRQGGFSKPSRLALDTYTVNINRLTGDRHRPFHGHTVIDPQETPKGLGTAHESYHQLVEAAVEAAISAADSTAAGTQQ